MMLPRGRQGWQGRRRRRRRARTRTPQRRRFAGSWRRSWSRFAPLWPPCMLRRFVPAPHAACRLQARKVCGEVEEQSLTLPLPNGSSVTLSCPDRSVMVQAIAIATGPLSRPGRGDSSHDAAAGGSDGGARVRDAPPRAGFAPVTAAEMDAFIAASSWGVGGGMLGGGTRGGDGSSDGGAPAFSAGDAAGLDVFASANRGRGGASAFMFSAGEASKDPSAGGEAAATGEAADASDAAAASEAADASAAVGGAWEAAGEALAGRVAELPAHVRHRGEVDFPPAIEFRGCVPCCRCEARPAHRRPPAAPRRLSMQQRLASLVMFWNVSGAPERAELLQHLISLLLEDTAAVLHGAAPAELASFETAIGALVAATEGDPARLREFPEVLHAGVEVPGACVRACAAACLTRRGRPSFVAGPVSAHGHARPPGHLHRRMGGSVACRAACHSGGSAAHDGLWAIAPPCVFACTMQTPLHTRHRGRAACAARAALTSAGPRACPRCPRHRHPARARKHHVSSWSAAVATAG